MQKKVLQVLDYINSNSGVSSIVTNYYYFMQQNNIHVDFLVFKRDDYVLESKLEKSGAHIFETMQPGLKNIVEYNNNIKKFFELHGREYTIVHVHTPNVAFIVLKYAKKYNVNCRIIHSHSTMGSKSILKRFRNYFINKLGVSYANKYFACGELAANSLFGKKKNVVIMHNAIDFNKFSFNENSRKKIRDKLNINNEEIVLGHVGRFSDEKNHEFLIEILKELENTDITYKLVLIGDGNLRHKIEKEVFNHELMNNVIFVGVIDNVEEYYSAMDIFLLPSKFEGVPVVCIEAQAAGLPCIVSDTVTKEIMISDSVYYVGIDDAKKWKEKVIDTINKEYDRHESVINDMYSIDKQAHWLKELYMNYDKDSGSYVNI